MNGDICTKFTDLHSGECDVIVCVCVWVDVWSVCEVRCGVVVMRSEVMHGMVWYGMVG